jgi:NTE family protein
MDLMDEDGRQPVSHWLNHILSRRSPRSIAWRTEALRATIADPLGAVLAQQGEDYVPVDFAAPICMYAFSDGKETEPQRRSIRLVVASGIGQPAIETGGELPFDAPEIGDTMLQEDFPPNFEERLALVLGGGGAKGAAQAGAIKAVTRVLADINDEINVGAQVHYIVGSSIGAFNSLFVSSQKIDELEDFWTHVHPFKGLSLVRELRRRVPKKDLRVPVEVSRVNLQLGRVEYAGLESDDIYDEVRKSMRLPVLFPAVLSEGFQYVDGGVIANLPISRCIARHCYWIIVLGLETEQVMQRRFAWPIGQGLRALDIQGRELQRFQKMLLLLSSKMKRLAELADLSACTLDDLRLVSGVRQHFFTWNVLLVPLQHCISTSTVWFSRKRCRQDFQKSYEETTTFLQERIKPIVEAFKVRHPRSGPLPGN